MTTSMHADGGGLRLGFILVCLTTCSSSVSMFLFILYNVISFLHAI